jgi:hypothetical protein
MHLTCAEVMLVDLAKLRDYPMLQDGAVIIHSKISLESVPGLIISYKDDVFYMGQENEAKAQMLCGHIVTRDGMT